MKPSRSGSARRRRVAVAPRARSRRPAGSVSAAAIQFLEERVMLSGLALTELPVAAFGGAADPQTSVHGGACCCPGCMPYFQGDTTGAAAVSGTSGAPPFPLTETFRLHSLPGANFTIYLDFDGHTTSGTQWNVDFNAGADIVSPAFSIDSNFSDFNSLEREYIQRVWQRVAEDFAPFNVDVTTEDPGVERLRRSGPGDAQWGVRSIQTDDQSFLLDDIGFLIGGIAYLGSFQWNSDTPVFTFNGSGSTSLFDEMAAADTHSHEVGHSLGLSHDGRTSPLEEYYGGHGSPLDPTSWAPIMGAFFADGSDNQLTQWSRGEYPNASQTQDDLRIITDPSLNGAGWGYSGLSYRADDHGNTTSGATALTVLGTSLTGSGLIEQGSDRDVFAFDAVAGQYTFDFRPYDRGPNLDILAELLDASGRVVASSNPVNALSASVTTFLTAGRYYLRVDGTGKPAAGSDFGYSDYGSLGWYTIDGVLDFAEDAYDENDTRTTAADPRGNGGQWEQTWLSAINGPGIANDEDWYVIDVTPGYLRVVAELDYNYADGDIDLGLWDANGREVAFSEDQDDDERIDFVVSAAGRYYLRVYSYFPYRATPYDLRWDDLLTGTPLVPTVGVSVSPASVAENGGSGLVFTFTRSAVGEPLKVDFGVGGTAALGTDYTQ
ncbi:MAG TPA: M12 family metallo-peptidase, partial [Planctomycetaceae bacterium]